MFICEDVVYFGEDFYEHPDNQANAIKTYLSNQISIVNSLIGENEDPRNQRFSPENLSDQHIFTLFKNVRKLQTLLRDGSPEELKKIASAHKFYKSLENVGIDDMESSLTNFINFLVSAQKRDKES